MNPASQPDASSPLVTKLPDLLLLLADVREQFERARLELAEAEHRTERAVAEADDLRTDVERTAHDLAIAQIQRDGFADQLDVERQDRTEQFARLEASHLAQLASERQRCDALVTAYEEKAGNLRSLIAEANVQRDEARAQVEELVASRSWQITAPIRALSRRGSRTTPSSPDHGTPTDT